MRNSENTSEIRPLTDVELDHVNGAVYLAGAVVMTAALCALAGAAWDLPIGATKAQAAAALGVSHLL